MAGVLTGPVRQVEPDALSIRHVSRDVALVLGLVIGAFTLGRFGWLPAPVSPEQTSHYLAFAAGSVGLAAAALCGVVHRLTHDRRFAWTGAALAIYALITVPACALREDSETAVPPVASDDLTFSVVRLLGLLIVLAGVAQMAWRSLRALAEQEQRQREKLRQAEAGLAEIAERHHELRNGIAGLAGVTEMLDRPVDETRQRVIRSAVASELCRLDALLDGDLLEAGQCEVAEVLREVEVLWHASGLEINTDIPAGLQVGVPRAVLIQTMANLLTNCMRHAPRSPVAITALRAGDRATILVADSGPGLAPGVERQVFERGTRGAGSRGRGLGLAITRNLLAAHGGTIEFLPVIAGCTVAVELLLTRPTVPAPRQAPREPAPSPRGGT